MFRAALLVGLGACLLGVLDYAATPSYPVFTSGGVLITGASTGIGWHAAMALARQGFRVYCGVRNAKAAEEIQGQKVHGGGSLVPVILDVTLEETVEAAYETIRKDLEHQKLQLVGLVNCAGVSRRLPLELETLDVVKDMYEVNVFGVTRVTQRFLELLRSSKGRIINVGSIAALLPHRGSSSYSGSKAALEMITDTLRLELAPWEISVSIIEPGYVQTPLAGKQLGDNAPWRGVEDATKRQLYQDWIASSDRSRQEAHDKAPGPSVTSEAMLHAMTSQKPKTRYVVANVKGIPAWMMTSLGWLLPDRIKDVIVKKF